MALLVEVGGVTRGTPADRPGGARSPWVRPVVVDLSCGAALQRRVEVAVGQVPGFQVESDALVLPTGDRSCEVRPIDDGVEPAVNRESAVEPPATVRIDGQEWHRGDAFIVTAEEPGERLVKVNVTFAAAALTQPAPVRPPGAAASGDQPLSPMLTIGLAGVFALGLAGAVARARRPL